MLSGTFIQDVPFLMVRVWTAATISDSRAGGPGFSLLYALLIKSICAVSCAAAALVLPQTSPPPSSAADGDPESDGTGQVRYRGLVRGRAGSLTADGLIQQLPDNDADVDDEHFV